MESTPPSPISRLDQSDLLFQGDGLELARALASESLDLVYLDPPFGTGQRRESLKGRDGRHREALRTAYDDPRPREGGLDPWLLALLQEARRLLRPGGALFLHLDWRANHHARLALDRMFGAGNFLNEIIWHYATGGIPTQWFARKHDTILYYHAPGPHRFHRMQEKKYLAHKMSRRGVPEAQDEGGWYRYRFLDDVWNIPWLTQDAHERTGYPTQKPIALLERMLLAASEEGDLVADFCFGSGTTAHAARRHGRRFLGADVAPAAVEVAERRLREAGEARALRGVERLDLDAFAAASGAHNPALPLVG